MLTLPLLSFRMLNCNHLMKYYGFETMAAEHLPMARLSFMVLRSLGPLPLQFGRVRSCLITETSEPSCFEHGKLKDTRLCSKRSPHAESFAGGSRF